MYRRRFIEFNFSLEKHIDKKIQYISNKVESGPWPDGKHMHYCRWKKDDEERNYPSEESKTPWSTVLSALAAVAPTHIINPKRWKLGSP